MKEIDCRKCKNCDTLKGCMKYGSNPWIAVKRCAAAHFKNYIPRGIKNEKNIEIWSDYDRTGRKSQALGGS